MLNSESLNFTFSTGTIMILPHHHHHNLVHRPSLCVSHYISSARVASKAMSPGNPPTGHSGIKWHFNHEKKSSVMKANLQATNLTIVSTKEETTIRKQQQKRINNNKKTRQLWISEKQSGTFFHAVSIGSCTTGKQPVAGRRKVKRELRSPQWGSFDLFWLVF